MPASGDGDDLTDIKSTKLTDRVHELNSISKHGELPYTLICLLSCPDFTQTPIVYSAIASENGLQGNIVWLFLLTVFWTAVERPSEQADDSEVFYTLTQKGAEMAKRVAAGKVRLTWISVHVREGMPLAFCCYL